MMLPILISASVAPVSYFFWASALPEVAAKAMTAVRNAAILGFCNESIASPFFRVRWSALPELADQVLRNHRDLPRAMRHQEDDEEQKYAEYRTGEPLGNTLGDVRHEDDKGRADDRSRQPPDATDHHAEKQRDRQRDGVAVGRHELHGDGAEAAGN